jgi:hypothetical protein
VVFCADREFINPQWVALISGNKMNRDKMKAKINTIEEVKMQIIDTSLIVASFIGTVAYLISLSRIIAFGFNISFVINFFIVAGIIIITRLRSRISILLKIYVIDALIILLSLSDAFDYGLLSAARIYMILIPSCIFL